MGTTDTKRKSSPCHPNGVVGQLDHIDVAAVMVGGVVVAASVVVILVPD